MEATLMLWIRTGVLLLATGAFVALPQGGVNFGLTGEEPSLAYLDDLSLPPPTGPFQSPHKQGSQLCHLMQLKGVQKRLCRRDHQLAKVLYEAAILSTNECKYQFRGERWNCALGVYRSNILRKGYRETAFLYAMSAAGLVHTLSRACSTHQLERCSCAPSVRGRKDAWLWGGCDDNIQFGLRFTKRFFQAKALNKDLKANIDRHNSRVGLKVVKNGLHKTCKCHGVSGSCTTQTCWHTLSEFEEIGKILKMKYRNAVRYPPGGSHNNAGEQQLSLRKRRRLGPRKRDLLFLEDSINFCDSSDFSPGTKGRECNSKRKCEEICCGRGHNLKVRMVRKPCNCTFTWCCHATCNECMVKKEMYTCK
uniref:Protein Wnt n=1 Tax=Platynereis dumerilii TaxID=6359 RepID=Q8MPL5_PLADU|nr:Wnt9/14/15 protein [Platynereis dumerilii]